MPVERSTRAEKRGSENMSVLKEIGWSFLSLLSGKRNGILPTTDDFAAFTIAIIFVVAFGILLWRVLKD